MGNQVSKERSLSPLSGDAWNNTVIQVASIDNDGIVWRSQQNKSLRLQLLPVMHNCSVLDKIYARSDYPA